MENTVSDSELSGLHNITADEIATALAASQAALPVTSVQYAEVALTSTEIKALYTTPKTLVAAPGAGKVLEFLSAVLILDYGTAAYATNGDLTVKQTNGSGVALSNTVLLANLLAATADKIVALEPAGAADTGEALTANAAIVLACGTGNPATGDGVMRVKVAYRVHTTGL